MNSPRFIYPEWSAPGTVCACVSLRGGGHSQGAYAGFNLSDRAGDDDEHVRQNRRLLKTALNLPAEPIWLEQVHGKRVIEPGKTTDLCADAAVAFEAHKVCAVLTADCLPILLCDRAGTRVSAVHAGWKGLAQGIVAEAVRVMDCLPDTLLAWLGPAIGSDAYQVGDDVRDAFLASDERYALAFLPDNLGRWTANLCCLARVQLNLLGVKAVYGGRYCTYTDKDKFFSYRRDGGVTGRMASLIWIE